MAVEHLCLGCMSYLKNPDAPCPNCGWFKTKKNAVSQLQAGYTLTNENKTEEYTIGRALGQGGFGVSYLAWNENRGERVVVKEFFPATIATRDSNSNVLPINANDAAQLRHGLDNFLKEAYKMLEFSNNPNVVNVKNFFQANNTAYIVMEFIDGQTLKQVIENSGGRLFLNDVLNKLAPIAGVLEQMHKPKINKSGQILRQPLLHRDISPENIMFTRNGIVKLLDFGAARNFEDNASGIIRTGYSPPEQFITNDPNFIQGSWTDVYALAATIYYAVTGHLPPNSISRLGSDSLILPSSLGVKLEPFQEKALLKGLSPDYRKRYQTVGEFINSLYSETAPQTNDKNKLIASIALSLVGALISAYLFIFALDLLIEESILPNNFVFSFLAAGISTACLGAFAWDLVQFYRRQRPKFLCDVFRQDTAFLAQVVCALVFLFFAFVYGESWDDSFIGELQFKIFLNSDLYSEEAETLVYMIILFYAPISIAGAWLGRQFLRKTI